MLKQHPRSVRKLRDFNSNKLEWPISERIVKTGMSTATFQQKDHMIAEGLVERRRTRHGFLIRGRLRRGLRCPFAGCRFRSFRLRLLSFYRHKNPFYEPRA